jgi:hypothetical protein
LRAAGAKTAFPLARLKAKKVLDIQYQNRTCWLLEEPKDVQNRDTVLAWLSAWRSSKASTAGGSGSKQNSEGGEGEGAAAKDRKKAEEKFWRQRTVESMEKRLRPPSAMDLWDQDVPPGTGMPSPGATGDTCRIYALQPSEEPYEDMPPLALALTEERRFPLNSLRTLHLDKLVSRPQEESSTTGGAGAALVHALLSVAESQGQVLTVEPQSSALETYFSRLGFRHAPDMDPYLWFHAGSGGSYPRDEGGLSSVDLRYILPSREDYERLLGAFKRAPIRIATSEEAFFGLRQDSALARDVFAVRVRRSENAARPQASVMHFQRSGPGAAYEEAGKPDSVGVNEALAVMRNPEMLRGIGWKAASALPSSGAHGGPMYMTLGSCSVVQRVYPFPGFGSKGIEMVIDSLELPMRPDPFYSLTVRMPLGMLGEGGAEMTKRLLEDFKVRATFHPASSSAWNLEVATSDGLVAASLGAAAEPMPLPELEYEKEVQPVRTRVAVKEA